MTEMSGKIPTDARLALVRKLEPLAKVGCEWAKAIIIAVCSTAFLDEEETDGDRKAS